MSLTKSNEFAVNVTIRDWQKQSGWSKGSIVGVVAVNVPVLSTAVEVVSCVSVVDVPCGSWSCVLADFVTFFEPVKLKEVIFQHLNLHIY